MPYPVGSLLKLFSFVLFSFVLFFGPTSQILINKVNAQITPLVLEGENMTFTPGSIQIFSDGVASGGQGIVYYSNASATATLSTQGQTNSIILTAKAEKCSGNPKAIVSIDGLEVLNINITTTGWLDYTATVSIPAGDHLASVEYPNDFENNNCDRNLRVDKLTLNQDVLESTPTPTPSPTPTPTSSPTPTPTPVPTSVSDNYLGYNAIAPSGADSIPNVVYASRFTMLPEFGNAFELGAYVENIDPTNKSYQLAIYSDSNDSPGIKLVETSVGNLVSGWNTLPIPVTVLNSGSTYWLAFITNGVSNLKFDTGTPGQFNAINASEPGSLPSSFGTPVAEYDMVQSIRAGYTPLSNKPLVALEGDSLSYLYPDQVGALLGDNWQVINVSTPGHTTVNMLSEVSYQVDPLYSPIRSSNTIVLWGGTNDLAVGYGVDSTYQNIVNYASGRKTLGFRVLVTTILPRSAGIFGITVEEFENQRQVLNNQIRSNWSSFADGLIDVAADPRIGDFGDELNTTYYVDQIHLTTAGDAIVTEIVTPQVSPGIYPPPPYFSGYTLPAPYTADSVPGIMYATRFTMPQSGNAYNIGVHIGNVDVINRAYQLAIYSDNNGSPGNKLAESAIGNLVLGWNTLTVPSIPLAQNDYWFVYITSGTSNLSFDAGATGQLKFGAATVGSLPSSFGTPLDQIDLIQSIRFLYFPAL